MFPLTSPTMFVEPLSKALLIRAQFNPTTQTPLLQYISIIKSCGLNTVFQRFVRSLYDIPPLRTLLALGCRVVQANPNAESSLKKIKLPKK